MMRRRHVSLSITAFTAGALSVAPISGLVADGQDDWHYQAMLYFWTAGIEGETAGGAEVDVGFDALINNLNMAFMGAFEARKAQWSLRADLVHLNVGADDRGTVPGHVTSGAAVELDVSANVETRGWVINLSAGYNLIDTERASLWLQWTTSASGRRLGLILHHTDGEREYAYDRESHIGRLGMAPDLAPEHGWILVSM